jgi:hypothetical protein
MMVTSRWLESLLAGCIVAGKRPVSRMADDMLAWPGATHELADDPREAGDQLEALLGQGDALDAQRQRNVREMLLRHDWRYRIEALCGIANLPVPAALREDLGRVQDLATRYA